MSENSKNRYIELAIKWADCAQTDDDEWMSDELDMIWDNQLTDQERDDITFGWNNNTWDKTKQR